MVNIGVSLKLPEGFSDRFKDYHFTVQFGNRSVEISNGETAYFPSSEVTYILSVTNNDGENKTNSKTIKSPVAGTIYEISNNGWDTRDGNCPYALIHICT